jgi:serine phosphatase RsbU (regulator of sigma subunit)
VEEVLLPGSPLGGIGTEYGARTLHLLPGDVAVWLSDGLIEGTDEEGNSFGYDRVAQCLAQPFSSADQARDGLLSSVADYTGNRPPEDDRTLVVMRFAPPADAEIAEA